MEQLPSSPEQVLARQTALVAQTALDQASSIELSQRYTAQLGSDYHLELYAKADTNPNATAPDLRRMYLKRATIGSYRTSVFALDLMGIRGADCLRGQISQPYQLLYAAEAANNQQLAERDILEETFQVVQAIDAEQAMPIDKVELVDQHYVALMEGATISMLKHRKLTTARKATVCLLSHTLSGPDQDLFNVERVRWPRLRIYIRQPKDKIHTVFSMLHDGSFECYDEVADASERVLALMGEDNLQRNTDGQLLRTTGFHKAEIELAQYERVLGLRSLEMEQLEFVSDQLEKALLA